MDKGRLRRERERGFEERGPSCAGLGFRPNFSPSFLPGEREGEGGKVSARTRARGANARSAGVPATVLEVQKEQMQGVRGGEHLPALDGEI
jgi:hypothetical protein